MLIGEFRKSRINSFENSENILARLVKAVLAEEKQNKEGFVKSCVVGCYLVWQIQLQKIITYISYPNLIIILQVSCINHHKKMTTPSSKREIISLHQILPWSTVCPISSSQSSHQSLPFNYLVNEKVSLWQGDITTLQIDCIVNAAKSDLSGGGGIDGAIWDAAGRSYMADACLQLKGCQVGNSKFTKGFHLPAKYVLHTVGPQDQDGLKLKSCYDSCLQNFVINGLKSLAFCCIATGVYNYPKLAAAHIALSTTRQWLEINHQKVHRIIFCVNNNLDLSIYRDLMSTLYFTNSIDLVIAPSSQQKRKSADESGVTPAADAAVNSVERKSAGRKKKRNYGGFMKKTEVISERYVSFSELRCPDSFEIHQDEVKTDSKKSVDSSDGFWYNQAKNVEIVYSVGYEKNSIRLDHLLERGFPSLTPTTSVLTKAELDKFINSCKESIEIICIKTDIEDQNVESLCGPWKYIDSSKVLITHHVNGSEQSILLNNLRARGFPITRVKYYSYLQFKEVCKNIGKSVEEVKDNATLFMDCLREVNNYFSYHVDTVTSLQIEEYHGPQSYKDRNDTDRLYYYGKGGQFRYYRKKDLVTMLHPEYGQVKINQLLNNPAQAKFMTEQKFVEILKDINDNIRRNYGQYHHLFVPYSGPQCYEDLCIKPERLQYDLNYKTHIKKDAAKYDAPQKDAVSENLLETFDNSRFSLRVCEECDQIRVLGLRAAKKYPLCYYKFQDQQHFLKFRCDHLYGTSCDNGCDVSPVSSFDEITNNGRYLLYAEDVSYIFGYLIAVEEINQKNMYVRYTVIQAFGKYSWIYSDYADRGNHWLNSVSPEKWRIGSLTNSTGRWKGDAKCPVFNLCTISIQHPHEARSCQVFYDTHLSDVDHDDPTEEITFGSLTRVRNCHKLLSSLKLLYCVKCRRTLPGVENVDDVCFVEDGVTFDKSIKDIYKKSEIVHTTDMNLDKKFNNSAIYNAINTHASGVCTQCSQYYEIDEDGSVNPVFLNFASSQSESSQASQSSQNSCKMETSLKAINIWGPENLFTLDLFSDESYACFMRSLTTAENLVITPFHIMINVLRCRATQMPFTKNSSIGFPLKSPMETNELPWSGFRNLPFIVLCYSNGDGGVEKEAKINLENIVRAKEFMSQRFSHEEFPNGRPRYRFVENGFCTFTNQQMEKLRNELLQPDREGYAEPHELRTVHIEESVDELSIQDCTQATGKKLDHLRTALCESCA